MPRRCYRSKPGRGNADKELFHSYIDKLDLIIYTPCTMQPHIVNQKEVNNHYKKIFDMVRTTKKPAIVTLHKQPHIAIITMEDYAELEKIKQGKSTQALLDLAQQVRHILKTETLPNDLAENHDAYLWEDANEDTKKT